MAGGLPEKKNKRQNTDFEIIVIIAGTAHYAREDLIHSLPFWFKIKINNLQMEKTEIPCLTNQNGSRNSSPRMERVRKKKKD